MGWIEVIGIVASSSVLTTIGGWFFGRRMNNAEAKKSEAQAKGNELDNVEKAVKIWRDLADELKTEIETWQHKVEELTVKIESYETRFEEKCKSCDYRRLYYNDLEKQKQG